MNQDGQVVLMKICPSDALHHITSELSSIIAQDLFHARERIGKTLKRSSQKYGAARRDLIHLMSCFQLYIIGESLQKDEDEPDEPAVVESSQTAEDSISTPLHESDLTEDLLLSTVP
eukprot:GHVR01037250.1.p1 GENE.GHVR01037250.1~~GHVR01037250.1.p1  ORF type:complete len:117 (-),score=19.94 GHVR01037250.1:624-974(-)